MFLQAAAESEIASRMYQRDLENRGFVMNLSRAWAWRPDVFESFLELRTLLTKTSSLTQRELAVLVCATASSLGDSYCALAWGNTLAKASDASTAAAVLRASESTSLTDRETALSKWARKVVKNPSATTAQDVNALRSAGFSEQEIFEATAFIAFRLAFSTVNDALGAAPDREIAEAAPLAVREAVTFGRPNSGRH
jgi:uncharacterized peroxidase-related enzyme